MKFCIKVSTTNTKKYKVIVALTSAIVAVPALFYVSLRTVKERLWQSQFFHEVLRTIDVFRWNIIGHTAVVLGIGVIKGVKE